MAVDDGFIPPKMKGFAKAPLVGVVLCENLEPAFIDVDFILSDSLDAHTKIVSMSEKAISVVEGIRALVLDGVTYGGFNIVDPDRLSESIDKPVIVFFRYELNLDEVMAALRRHFPDWSFRFSVIEHAYKQSKSIAEVFGASGKRSSITCIGISFKDAINLLLKFTVMPPIPHPLRLADRIASAIGRFYYGILKGHAGSR